MNIIRALAYFLGFGKNYYRVKSKVVFMKTSLLILYILVVLSLVLSVTAVVLLVTKNSDNTLGPEATSTPAPTTSPAASGTPSTTNTPTPTVSPSSDASLSLSYSEASRQSEGSNTKVVLSVNITYQKGGAVTLSYSQFYLQLYAPRMVVLMYVGTVNPQNSGTFTLGPSHSTEVFQLTFEFPTESFNGMDTATTGYELQYNGTATINWTNQSYH
jgi:hypothetical protein